MIVDVDADRSLNAGERKGEGGAIHLVDDLPRHAANAALGRGGDLVVGVGREVEIAVGACFAPVG